MRRLASVLGLAVLLAACGGGGTGSTPCCTEPPIEQALAGAAHVTSVVESTGDLPAGLRDLGYRLFRLEIEQPADHLVAGGATFQQFASLLWKGHGLPVVFATNGYGAARTPGRSEPAALLGANQLAVEHRFFAPSAPVPLDWSLLTIGQAAADHHLVVESLKPVLGGKWISTGASKGGMTAVYHRRFWPDDVDGTVAYVAPTSTSTSDPAYVTFLESVGTPACRQALKDAQHALLARRAEVQPLFEAAPAPGDGYTTFGPEKAFDYAVVELSFAFWQYGPGLPACANIPAPDAAAATLFAWMDATLFGVADWIGDASLDYYAPYYYQSATQLGGPAYPQDHLLDVLPGGIPADDLPELYPPLGVTKTWDAAAMPDVSGWVTASGAHILFVYGENDPWSSRPFEPDAANDAFRYFVPAGNHGSSLSQLPAADHAEAVSTLQRWAGVVSTALTVTPEPGVDFDPWALLEGERGIAAVRDRTPKSETGPGGGPGAPYLDAPARVR